MAAVSRNPDTKQVRSVIHLARSFAVKGLFRLFAFFSVFRGRFFVSVLRILRLLAAIMSFRSASPPIREISEIRGPSFLPAFCGVQFCILNSALFVERLRIPPACADRSIIE